MGLVQLFTGDGKGKTSAALGVVVRALGYGLKVHLISFMKGDYPYGEHDSLSQFPNISISRFGHQSFVDPLHVKPAEREQASAALNTARESLLCGRYDLVVLDEVNLAAAWGLVEVEEVLEVVRSRPDNVELVLTGRYAHPRLVQAADLVTEMVEVKHPYRRGMLSRKGFEY